MVRFALAWIVALLAAGTASWADEPTTADLELFEREVRPILVERCHKCHGEVAQPKGGLSLVSREAVLKGGESGPAAVAGNPAASRLIAAVNYDGLEMPPDGQRLAPAQIASLTRWIERGLPWPKLDPAAAARAKIAAEDQQITEARRTFWSFQPIRRPALPAVSRADWPQTPVDYFVLAELEKRGLSPSPPADRRTLVRRLYFDLLGLPPEPADVDRFLSDAAPGAVQRLVDRLLASPRYGERWARHWLDVARYADTKGYVLNQDSKFPWSYTYRDYVVRAFNADLPFDRFIVEQLAADRLPLGPDKRALAALGFLTLGNGFLDNQQDVIDDRIDVVTRGLLGLTVACARCHDHKFDPIPTRDYYALYGVFASSVEPEVPPLFDEPPNTPAYAEFAKELAEREHKLAEFLDGKFNELVSGARSRVAEYLLAANAQRGKPTTEDFMLLADGADLNPTMILRYQVYLERTAAANDPIWTLWHALANLPADRFDVDAPGVVERLIAGASPGQVHPLVAGAFLGKRLGSLDDAAKTYAELLLGVDKMWRTALDEARAAGKPAPERLADDGLESLRQVFYGATAPANPARGEINELALLPDRPAQMTRTKLRLEIEKWRANGPAAPPRAMALADLPVAVRPRVFLRGNPNNLGDEVPRRFLRVLSQGEPAPFATGSGRLELARAIASADNPLTARVLVNRVWLEHFGSALVRTPSDFGLRCEPPTHPELLDYLAGSFIDGGWSIKRLHRLIVLSATYAQASDDRPECRAIDPENTLLWRMNRRRLDFESTRDALLAVAGRLATEIGGPSVSEIGKPGGTRRTMYGHIDRLNLPGLYRTFDFPNPDTTSPARSLTTIPQQALFFMNSPLAAEAAGQLLGRPEVAGEADAARRLGRLYQLVYARQPAAEEIDWAVRFLADAADQAAGWNQLVQALLLSNEFVFVD